MDKAMGPAGAQELPLTDDDDDAQKEHYGSQDHAHGLHCGVV